jgi:hypothetical protein
MNVLHRHLSLTNAFDYPEYDNRLRDWFFNERKREYRDELKREAMPPIAPPVHRAPAAGGATKLSNRAIIVLGMHRSGTSAISGLLALHGVEMGRHLMPATVDNEAGYWEHAEIVQIHDEMLAALGSGWDDVCHLPSGWERSDTVAPFQQRLAEVLLRDFAASPFWAIKDPRLCRVWPLWEIILRELECQPFPVLMVRHPFETIRSLEKRDGFPPAKSELLWLQHLIESEGETRNAARVVVTFDQVLENPAVVFGRIKGALGGEWPRKPVPDEFARFLDPQKRHHRTPGTEGLSAWTLAAFEAAQRGAAGDDAAMRTGLDSVRVALESADALYRGELDTLFTLRAEFREAKRKLSAKSTQAKQLKEQVRALKQQVRALEKTAPVKFARFLKRLSGRPRNAPRVS